MMNDMIELQFLTEKRDQYAINIFDDYCKFMVQLPDTSMITLIMHKKDTLADLHQKLLNRLRSYRVRPYDEIPPRTTNQPTSFGTQSTYLHNQLQIHDIFTCRDDSPDILSIPSDPSIVIYDFLENHSNLFHSDDEYHTLYVIDNEYYIKMQNKKNEKKQQSMFSSLLRNTLVFLKC
jgi:hypothetical protein